MNLADLREWLEWLQVDKMPEPSITFTVEDLREPYRLERVLQQFLRQVVKLDTDQSKLLASLATIRQASRLGFQTSSGAIPGSPSPDAPTGASIVYAPSVLTDHAIVLGSGGVRNVKAGTLGTTTTVLHGNAGGDPSYSAVVLTTDVSGILPAANGGTGVSYDRIADTVARTAQVADIGSTAFANSSIGSTFRVSYYLETTTADGAAGTVTLTTSFTDDAGATTVLSAALPLTALGRTSGVFFVQRASGSIAYSTSHTGVYGTSQYALYISLERLS